MKTKTKDIIFQKCEELLQKLEIEATVAISEKEGVFHVQIDSNEAGIIIGHHGRTLDSFQLVLGSLVFKEIGEWVKLSVSSGDYRVRREKQLQELALTSAERVINTKEDVELEDLSPAERRIVHIILTDHPHVVSESTGEGRYRKLIIRMRR